MGNTIGVCSVSVPNLVGDFLSSIPSDLHIQLVLTGAGFSKLCSKPTKNGTDTTMKTPLARQFKRNVYDAVYLALAEKPARR